MKAITKFLAGGVAIAALASAAPAAAQYYPGYGRLRLRLSGYGGNVVGQVINQVLGGGYGDTATAMAATARSRSTSASARSRQRLSGGGYGGYGYSGYGYTDERLWRRPGARHQPGRAALERRPDRPRRRQQRPLCRCLRLWRPGARST